MPYDLESIATHFCTEGAFVSAEACGSGHINDTYVMTCNWGGERVRYLLQRINHQVFQDPVGVMGNISRVTAHIQTVLQEQGVSDVERRCLRLVPTWEDKPVYRDESGSYWRTYLFIEGATSHDVVKTEEQAYEAAKAFGEFQKYLLDLPGQRLIETIPDFHNTPKRYAQFERALATNERGRAAKARAEIEFACRHRATADALLRLHHEGKIPERITHNDTKLNNVLLDEATNEGLCVIDLDTVMPGLGLYDIGDLVRSCTSPAKEDEQDLSQVVMQMPMFKALVRGYLVATRSFLTQAELDHLAFSGKLIALETGLRFLTDYLMGDVYFKTQHEAHNLERCRVQFGLVESIEAQQEAMNQLVKKLAR
jgi:aminoglycoside phosphotransferase (APT) family kinase protein